MGKQEKVGFFRLGVGVQYHGRCAGAVGVCRRVQSRHGTHALPYVLWSRTIANLCLGQRGMEKKRRNQVVVSLSCCYKGSRKSAGRMVGAISSLIPWVHRTNCGNRSHGEQ